MAIISCPYCGEKVSDKAMACVHCGKNLKSDNRPAMPQQANRPVAPRPMPNTPRETETPPPTYMWLSCINGIVWIAWPFVAGLSITLLFGSLFCAVLPFIMSIQVKTKWAQGNEKGAKSASNGVLALNIIFIILMIATAVILNKLLNH